ncbi:TetR/AcrR family transcriptional regulator [Roseomonas sp. USHLN139]|uniref:TetR/AcrR family transcriptional regulator n=1 Tax=Roseomonas sp. USHLN139 TaxID=3081298 RepID=UPI003B022C22
MSATQRQARGRARLGVILDAADAVLQRRASTELSLQEVAVEAGLPVASVYHYFQGSQALLLALAQRYMQAFEALAESPVDRAGIAGWRDLSRLHAERSLAFYRAHPVAMRLLLGPESGWQIRAADLAANRRIGAIQYRRLRFFFSVAESETLERAFTTAVTIGDAVWALGFAEEGDVSAARAEESLRARLAYLRLYLGEIIEQRETPGAAA